MVLVQICFAFCFLHFFGAFLPPPLSPLSKHAHEYWCEYWCGNLVRKGYRKWHGGRAEICVFQNVFIENCKSTTESTTESTTKSTTESTTGMHEPNPRNESTTRIHKPNPRIDPRLESTNRIHHPFAKAMEKSNPKRISPANSTPLASKPASTTIKIIISVGKRSFLWTRLKSVWINQLVFTQFIKYGVANYSIINYRGSFKATCYWLIN